MLKSKTNHRLFSIFFLCLLTSTPLIGQSKVNYDFVLRAHRSVKYIESYYINEKAIFKSYVTYHPLSISNDTVSLYLSNIVVKDNGKMTIDQGRIVHIHKSLLPTAPLQLLVQPIVLYINDLENFRSDKNFRKRFTNEELDVWTACGYIVQEPGQIGYSFGKH